LCSTDSSDVNAPPALYKSPAIEVYGHCRLQLPWLRVTCWFFCNSELKNCWHGRLGIESTTFDICSQSCAYDLSAMATQQGLFMKLFHATHFFLRVTFTITIQIFLQIFLSFIFSFFQIFFQEWMPWIAKNEFRGHLFHWWSGGGIFLPGRRFKPGPPGWDDHYLKHHMSPYCTGYSY